MGKTSVVMCLAVALLFSSSCSINVKKEKNGEDKQVDINTLVGGIHVSKDASPGDIGLPVYPGARLKEKDSGDDKSANVDVSGFGYGVKVVALEFESKDPPAKLVAYYRDQLQKYGHILECHTTGHLDIDTDFDDNGRSTRTRACVGDSGKNIELRAGARDNQHIVAVEPSGSGSNFSLVYVRTHGKEADI